MLFDHRRLACWLVPEFAEKNTIEIQGARPIDDPVQDEVPFVQQVLVFGLRILFLFRALVMFLRVCVFLSVSSL
jgi:hypothetical protein